MTCTCAAQDEAAALRRDARVLAEAQHAEVVAAEARAAADRGALAAARRLLAEMRAALQALEVRGPAEMAASSQDVCGFAILGASAQGRQDTLMCHSA